ncbi:hypothetical protein D3C78_1732540 [compost metagenome]
MDPGIGVIQFVKQHPGGSQSRVAAEVNFTVGGKPAQLNAPFVANKKGGLRLVVLLRHL